MRIKFSLVIALLLCHGAVALAQNTKVPEITHDNEELKQILELYEPDIELYEKDKKALEKANQYIRNNMPVTRDEFGRVILTYGDSLPTVVCSPIVVCVLDLQPGESVVGKLHLGDPVRWDVLESFSGSRNGTVTNLIIKPKDVNIGTTLFIPTDRRAYTIRLISLPKTYMPHIAFEYPGDRAFKKQLKAEQVAKLEAKIEERARRRKNYAYDIKGDPDVAPYSVYDDGIKTYIVMDRELQTLPALLLKGNDKKTPYKIVNYRVKDNEYIVDRLFTDTAKLVLDTGNNKREVTIKKMDEGRYRAGNTISLKKKSDELQDTMTDR